MMTPEQRQPAAEIAGYVRREVREEGLALISDLAAAPTPRRARYCGECVWVWIDGRPAWTRSPVALSDGIPDLSDPATIDALLRHLQRRGWIVSRQIGRFADRCCIVRRLVDIATVGYKDAWLAAARAINEEANRET